MLNDQRVAFLVVFFLLFSLALCSPQLVLFFQQQQQQQQQQGVFVSLASWLSRMLAETRKNLGIGLGVPSAQFNARPAAVGRVCDSSTWSEEEWP